MPVKNRLKISAALNSFNQEIDRLKRFDYQNHEKFSRHQLTKAQIELMVESIFFAGFRAYEGFIREIFLLYCLEKTTPRKGSVKSYLRPKNFMHTEELIKSSMPFLDWTSPGTIITRAEAYLEDGYPIKLPYTTNQQSLGDFKKLRNHIAHASHESELEFKKLLKNYFNGVQPIANYSPGQYLMLSSKSNVGNYLLLDFFKLMEKISVELT